MLYKSYIIDTMCNVYKNNLIVLSQLNNSQLIYYDNDNQLRPDDRYLSYFRPGTKESKISYIIKTSFLQIFNCYIINIVSQETQKEGESNTQLLEIENKKHLLRKSLEGLEKYQQSLQEHQHNYEAIEKLNSELNSIFNNIDDYKLEYLLTIQTPTETKSESKSWLYKLYESTLKSSPKNDKSRAPLSTLEDISEDNDENNNEDENEVSDENISDENGDINNGEEESSNNITQEEETEPQLGDYFPENLEDTDEYEHSYLRGILYIFSKKIFGIFITIGKHVNFFF